PLLEFPLHDITQSESLPENTALGQGYLPRPENAGHSSMHRRHCAITAGRSRVKPDEDRSAFWTLTIGVIAASLSGAAILLHAFGGVHLAFSVIVLAPMTLVMILCLGVWAKPRNREIFLQRL